MLAIQLEWSPQLPKCAKWAWSGKVGKSPWKCHASFAHLFPALKMPSVFQDLSWLPATFVHSKNSMKLWPLFHFSQLQSALKWIPFLWWSHFLHYKPCSASKPSFLMTRSHSPIAVHQRAVKYLSVKYVQSDYHFLYTTLSGPPTLSSHHRGYMVPGLLNQRLMFASRGYSIYAPSGCQSWYLHQFHCEKSLEARDPL